MSLYIIDVFVFVYILLLLLWEMSDLVQRMQNTYIYNTHVYTILHTAY